MTREELDKLKALVYRMEFMTNVFINGERDVLNKAIKALEQESCEDCISRQAAIDALMSVPDGNWKSIRYVKEIELLPSVTPARKIGHWTKYQEPWGGMQGWKCSNCRNHYDVSSVYTIIPYNYCPNCGAKMQEVDE